jgi:lipopolysaccharide heptosyltransferase II
LVSIIIPTCAARGLIETCIRSLKERTAYPRIEIVFIENIRSANTRWKDWIKQHSDSVIETSETFNWSRYNNIAAAQAHGEYLLFMNDDTEILESDWLDALVEHAQRPEVGAVGPLLLYPDGRIQHAGLFLTELGAARHAFRYSPETDAGYFGLALTQRNVIGVTGACLLTRRETFLRLQGFDERHTIINNDLDYCLRVWRAGLRTIYTPHARIVHHEMASRGELGERYDREAFADTWRNVFLKGDPYFHPKLALDRDDYVPASELPVVYRPRRPLIARDSIKSIFALKLDHIGDCVTALPAVRRLKHHFPDARIHILAAPSTLPIWAAEPAVDEVIEFEFYHTRSALGPKEVSESALDALADRLAAYRFDVAIDLRKQFETRTLLQRSGARLLAGFDYQGRFPWLDVALEWEGDSKYGPKRAYIGDELVTLVEAIVTALEPPQALLHLPKAEPLHLAGRKGGRLGKKPIVAIHPGSGNDLRQWPSKHFAGLIDLLVETEDVHVILVGGPGDKEIGTEIERAADRRKSLWNLIGQLDLEKLPLLFAHCAIFIGNNSGPQHIAAAYGLPVIGIYSGVVDAREWGPLGPRAVAIRREMSCGPCYLSKPEECHRQLECLTGLLPIHVLGIARRLLREKLRGPTQQGVPSA